MPVEISTVCRNVQQQTWQVSIRRHTHLQVTVLIIHSQGPLFGIIIFTWLPLKAAAFTSLTQTSNATSKQERRWRVEKKEGCHYCWRLLLYERKADANAPRHSLTPCQNTSKAEFTHILVPKHTYIHFSASRRFELSVSLRGQIHYCLLSAFVSPSNLLRCFMEQKKRAVQEGKKRRGERGTPLNVRGWWDFTVSKSRFRLCQFN